ncbi:hypothetical protein L914_19238 [Phytophthora nicotianae]|uniref:Uncharacterized protein n=3 Tax=Phytophthora nicotianae TaxID=4792 RepID=V9E438_PHYNI|nr:hypothetical protein F443_20016 [Phytophthora nicotianae P1569]ETM33543.1 hypothetical protein L914_19238 [Phytophthora nicotianae]ETO62036.1 hypothetical protein F444_20024 [Phytophthora nicotianae P1976]
MSVMALGNLSRDLGLLCGTADYLRGGVAAARRVGVPQAVTALRTSQLTMITVKFTETTKRTFLRGYRRGPLYKNITKSSATARQVVPNTGTVLKLDGLLFVLSPKEHVSRLCVPAGEALRTTLCAEAHDGRRLQGFVERSKSYRNGTSGRGLSRM